MVASFFVFFFKIGTEETAIYKPALVCTLCPFVQVQRQAFCGVPCESFSLALLFPVLGRLPAEWPVLFSVVPFSPEPGLCY